MQREDDSVCPSGAPIDGELILYQTPEDKVRIEVLYETETFWLDQRKMAALFDVDLRTISYNLRSIYDSGELDRARTLRKIWRVQTEGDREVRREIEFYNPDAVISVGYRVNNAQATVFRARQATSFESDFEREVKRIADSSRSGETGYAR
jgi:hypothetical protein